MSKDMLGIAIRKLVTLPNNVLGIVCDLLEKLIDPEWVMALKKFLRKENPWPEHQWREENGVIYFSVTSDGATGEEWISRLEGKGFRESDYAKSILRSSNFHPTSGKTTEVVVLKGMLFGDNELYSNNIRAKAKSGEFTGRNLSDPNAELACLIREKFSDEEIEAMGLSAIVTMHEPIEDSGGSPRLLGASRGGDGGWLNACWDDPGSEWRRDCGFAVSLAS